MEGKIQSEDFRNRLSTIEKINFLQSLQVRSKPLEDSRIVARVSITEAANSNTSSYLNLISWKDASYNLQNIVQQNKLGLSAGSRLIDPVKQADHF